MPAAASHPIVVITIVCLLFFVGSMVTPKLLAKKTKKKEDKADTQEAKTPEEEKTDLLGDGHDDGQDLADAEKGDPAAAATELAAEPAVDAPAIPEIPTDLPSRELENPTPAAKPDDVNLGNV